MTQDYFGIVGIDELRRYFQEPELGEVLLGREGLWHSFEEDFEIEDIRKIINDRKKGLLDVGFKGLHFHETLSERNEWLRKHEFECYERKDPCDPFKTDMLCYWVRKDLVVAGRYHDFGFKGYSEMYGPINDVKDLLEEILQMKSSVIDINVYANCLMTNVSHDYEEFLAEIREKRISSVPF